MSSFRKTPHDSFEQQYQYGKQKEHESVERLSRLMCIGLIMQQNKYEPWDMKSGDSAVYLELKSIPRPLNNQYPKVPFPLSKCFWADMMLEKQPNLKFYICYRFTDCFGIYEYIRGAWVNFDLGAIQLPGALVKTDHIFIPIRLLNIEPLEDDGYTPVYREPRDRNHGVCMLELG